MRARCLMNLDRPIEARDVLIEQMVTQACGRLEMARGDYRFSRRQVRESTGWSYEQIRVHLDRLVAMEYVLVHRGARGRSFVYELLYDGAGKDGSRFVMHLLEVDTLTE